MLYAVSYNIEFPTKREEAVYQRELAQRLLGFAMRREYGEELTGLKISRAPHGKPFFQNHPAKFSLSHCRGLVCCAVGGQEMGADAEYVRPYNSRLARRICTPEEWAFLKASPNRDEALITLWTLKESLMKLTGEGLRYGFQNAAFTFDGQGDPRPVRQEVQAVCFKTIPRFVISVCCRENPPKEINVIELPRLF